MAKLTDTWIVLKLPGEITTDDIEREEDDPGEYDKGYVDGFNAAIKAVRFRITGRTDV